MRLAEGPHFVIAQAADGTSESPPSEPWQFIVDTIPPPQAVITSPVEGASINVTRPEFTGAAEPGSMVRLESTTASAIVDGAGQWRLLPVEPLAEGFQVIYIDVIDLAGNRSAKRVSFVVDTIPPAAPTVQTPVNGSTLGTLIPLISGQAGAADTVTAWIDGHPAGAATASPTGFWSLTPSAALAPGTHVLVARAADAAGNVGPPGASVTFSLLTAPGGLAAPEIVVPVDGAFVSTPVPIVSGTAAGGVAVVVALDGIEMGLTNADDAGQWQLSAVALPDGAHALAARAVDGLGDSPWSSVRTFTVDTVAPPPPVLESPRADEVVREDAVPFRGTAEGGASVSVKVDGVMAGTPVADAAGRWSFVPAVPLSDGLHTVSLETTDQAGNTGPPSSELSFTVRIPRSHFDGGCSAVPASGAGACLLLLGGWARLARRRGRAGGARPERRDPTAAP